jgi:hypothetical protein
MSEELSYRVVEMWRVLGRRQTSRVFVDEGIAAKGSVESGEETPDLSRA